MLAVELFETADGVLVNELAMRPHNSGHWTIEGARTSQFEQHLRAVLDYPLGDTAMTAPVVVMANVLGGAAADDDWAGPGLDERIHHFMAHWPDVKLHWYGKGQRPGRKLGHVTALGADLAEVRARAVAAARYLADGVVDAAFAFDATQPSSTSTEEPGMSDRARPRGRASSWAATPTGRSWSRPPLALEEFDVPYEAHVLSAHRTPRRMLDYAEAAAGRGLRVIIAGAGGAAHLPGHGRRGHAAAGHRRPAPAGPARRAGQPAVDRADAGRGAGGDGRHRRRPQRRAARRPHPGRVRRRRCAPRWPGSRPTWPTRSSRATPPCRSASRRTS